MARKRYSDEDVLKLLREIDVHLHDGLAVLPYSTPAEHASKISHLRYIFMPFRVESMLR